MLLHGFDPTLIMIYVLVMFISFPIHEAAHGFVAMKLGDNTAKNMGRVTLNPIPHISLMGALMMIAVGFGFAKPVPVNPNNFTKVSRKVGMALTSLAGPVSNLLLAYVFLVFYRFVHADVNGNFIYVLSMIISLNIGLAIFNLIPIPPLDGSRILLLVLGERQYFNIMKYEMYSFLALFVLLQLGFMTGFLYTARNVILNLLFFLSNWVDVFVK
ncbi:peptidase [Clostridia bacterium]|nr:peptidase [Clostridia bacterium]